MGNFTELYCDENTDIEKYCIKEPITHPKVSIIVPAYNTEKYISRCLLSLIRQTLREIEIVVVNDGSTDNTASILSKFSESDSRIKIITQTNQKQGAARNHGTEAASGEYIGYVDSDDWVDFDYYEKLYIAAKKYNSDIALATNVRIGNGKTKKRLDIKEEIFITDLQSKIDVSHQVKNPCPTNKIYRRTFLKDNRITWPEGVYCEDKLFTIKCIYFANGLVTVPDVFYYYYRNPHSTVNSKSKKLTIDKNNAKRSVLNFLKEKNADIRDGDFWAIKKEKNIFGVSFYREEESLHTSRISVLGLKIKEFSIDT